jgi:invasion protein IalB
MLIDLPNNRMHWMIKMATLSRILPAALALALAVPAFAQSADSPLPVEPFQSTDELGETYVSEVFGDWEMQCMRTVDGSDPCQLYQLLRDTSGNPVAEISLFGLPDGQIAAAGATVVTPLETLLSEFVSISYDGTDLRRYPFTFCAVIGCVARIGLTAEEIELMKKGKNAVLSVVPMIAPDQRVEVEISLIGFTAGFEAVNAANALMP